MSVELNMEVSQSEYQPNSEVNRLEVYESLLLDTQSALWREVLHRKEIRSSKNTPTANQNTHKTKSETKTEMAGETEVFDIGSEEEDEEEKEDHKQKNKHTKEQGHDVCLSIRHSHCSTCLN